MPRIAGCSATEQIRHVQRKYGLARRAIVAVTANTYPDERQHYLAVGMDEV